MVQLQIATLAHSFNWELENGLNAKKHKHGRSFWPRYSKSCAILVHPKPRLLPHVYSSCF
ncbi:putative flavonoid 3'-monooxygenase [Medicago truncatula]|uniref:Putative flavonoid 3'-monooxygenase n=1 Tax=Medicago truncatula TaxID=3880 RepID=A0A396INB6_MEDTR|nr:putative flavonoid 3'-monooxygenase [Medicago truncatula]